MDVMSGITDPALNSQLTALNFFNVLTYNGFATNVIALTVARLLFEATLANFPTSTLHCHCWIAVYPPSAVVSASAL
jgi:hypothetical protein